MNDALLAGFPGGKISLQGETGLDFDGQGGVVLKLELEMVVTGVGGEFNVFYDLARDFREVDKFTIFDWRFLKAAMAG